MKFRSVAVFAVLVCALSTAAFSSANEPEKHSKVVGGYFEEWSIYGANFNVANLQANGVADKLTHLT